MSLAVKSAKARTQGTVPSAGRGDPGLFGFLGNIAKKALPFIPGVGPVASTALDLFGGGGRPQQVPRPGPVGAVQRFLPGGRTGMMDAPAGTRIACPSGHHPNKSDYTLLDGSFIAKGSRCVKNRRRNPLNPRAASRAIARIASAKKATAMLGRVTIRSAHHHHPKKKK